MNLFLKTFLLLICSISYAQSADWYSMDFDKEFQRMEPYAGGDVYLMRNSGFIELQGEGDETCYANQIKISAPDELRSMWYSIIMSVYVGASEMQLYGACNTTDKTLEVTRLLLDKK